MKFAIAVVILALGVFAQAGYVPLAYNLPYAAPLAAYQYAPLSYTARSLPLTYAAAPAIHYDYAPAVHTYAELRTPAAAIIPVAAEGTYTAVNKGAIHVAPLPGHSQSASSVNLEPAPGTY
ncbi:Adult cuticle protein 1 [Pseudolycoriella hygida]|uniref:Adult cuticle protein 1 n=1 Tax=Pseudolycoriella hygida TaxID=35572 RepID=A0A9Q0NFE9_9DIPT|nr:Adult cuticle protein 1 [Pseudolycoriella hygida]